MFELPPAMDGLISRFSIAFTRPTFNRFVVLVIAAILTPGRRTVLNILWTVRFLAEGHVSSYHRVFSRAPWSLWVLGHILAERIVQWVPADSPVIVAMDDHATLHKGNNVYGKAKHRDAVRSTHSLMAWLFGHKWTIMTICVKFPFASRPWALPVACALYRSKELDKAERRRHKTSIELAMGLMAMLCRWLARHIIFLGDGGFSSHAMACYAHRHRRRMTFIGKLHPDAALYDPPPARRRGTNGRPRLKGAKRLTPRQVVERALCVHITAIDWYGGKKRRVALITGVGYWYRSGQGLVPIRWVHVRDLDGTHREEYFFSTDLSMTPERIAGLYTARWSIEVTFQEVRTHLGLATPRNWSKNSVLRTAPCLLGLFSVVALIFAELHQQGDVPMRRVAGYAKMEPTFADALAAVRRELWQWFLHRPVNHRIVSKPPPKIITLLLDCLSYAA